MHEGLGEAPSARFGAPRRVIGEAHPGVNHSNVKICSREPQSHAGSASRSGGKSPELSKKKRAIPAPEKDFSLQSRVVR